MANPIPSPPPPPWDGAVAFDPAEPNDALVQALLGAWAGEDIAMIRRNDSKKLWVMWKTSAIQPL